MGWTAVVSSGRARDAAPPSPDHRRVPDRGSRCGPKASPGNDESDVARRGSHEGRKRMRPARKIQDDEVRAAADADPECRVRIRLTASAERHLEDLTRRHAAFHPGDAIRELHLSK